MSDEQVTPAQKFFKSLLTPWRITAILIGVFLLGQGYLSWRNLAFETALESHAPFATPEFELEFSRHLPYDPLSFIGRGARAGLWEWSPEGLNLTEEGSTFFQKSGERFVSQAVAGQRRISRFRTNREVREGERHIDFLYEWVEVSLPAAALVVPPPREEETYLGRAVLVREGGQWKVASLQTLDFEEPMAHLQEIATGELK